MNTDSEWITRAECARRIGVSPQMVSKHCRRGLEQAAGRADDTRLNWPVVEHWLSMYVSPFRSGNWRFRERMKELQPMTPRGLHAHDAAPVG